MIRIEKVTKIISADLIQNCHDSLKIFLQRKDIGFHQLTEQQQLWSQSFAEGKRLREQYKYLVVVGVGGSSLGAKVIADAYHSQNLIFIDNVDAQEWSWLSQKIELHQTAWLFISKSGNTIETLCTLEFALQLYQQNSLDFHSRCSVITELKSSSLYDWAQSHHISICEVPVNIGGRFSVLSPVGMVPAAFLGLNLDQFRRGAELALTDQKMIAELMSQVLASFQREEWITLFWPYCSRIRSFGLWYQQLWAESLAKKVNRLGLPAPRVSTPMLAIGTTDQHSLLQQVAEGNRDKFILFLRVLSSQDGEKLEQTHFKETKMLLSASQGELLKNALSATEESLSQRGISTMVLSINDINELSLGYLFMFFELLIAGLGETLNINAFDQPGVELGKVLTKEKFGVHI